MPVSGMDLEEMRPLLGLLADKWTIPVLSSLCSNEGRRRFNAIRRDVPSISQKSLVSCLRRLEDAGLVRRAVLMTGPLGVEYTVTPLGLTLEGPVQALLAWSQEHARAIQRSAPG